MPGPPIGPMERPPGWQDTSLPNPLGGPEALAPMGTALTTSTPGHAPHAKSTPAHDAQPRKVTAKPVVADDTHVEFVPPGNFDLWPIEVQQHTTSLSVLAPGMVTLLSEDHPVPAQDDKPAYLWYDKKAEQELIDCYKNPGEYIRRNFPNESNHRDSQTWAPGGRGNPLATSRHW